MRQRLSILSGEVSAREKNETKILQRAKVKINCISRNRAQVKSHNNNPAINVTNSQTKLVVA